MATAPAPPPNYDSSAQRIKVEPDQLYVWGNTTVPSLSKSIAESLNAMNTAWNALQFNWVGASATEAQDFNTKWSTLMSRLFGPDDPNAPIADGDAVLGKVAAAIASAGSKFGNSEDAVVKTFKAFSAPGQAPDGSGRNSTDGPITETNTPKVKGH